jgi:dihydroflavonol-4-reductase
MRILVTGGTGFLGNHLLIELARRRFKWPIRVLARNSSTKFDQQGIEVVTGSVNQVEVLAHALDGITHVYHLAGFVSRDPDDGYQMHSVHVDGTRILCRAAIAAGVKRMVVLSTSGTVAVSEREDELPDEDSPAPLSIISEWPYYASKYYQEEAARRFCGDKIQLIIVNPSLLLGPGDDRLGSTREVLSFLSGDIRLVPDGGLNFVDVRDVAAILPVAMEKGQPGRRYLLGGHNMTFVEFFDRLERLSKSYTPRLKVRGSLAVLAARAQNAVLKAMGRTPSIEPSAVAMAKYFWYFTGERAKNELGFAPREATQTLFDTITYVREHGMGEGMFLNKD